MPENYWFPITESDPNKRIMMLTGNDNIKINPIQKKRKKKYTCPRCNSNVWGKPNMTIICGCCMVPFLEQIN